MKKIQIKLMRYKDELYCKLDLVKQAVVDIEEYIEIIEEVQVYLESLKDGN